jgi:hypothetical protein
MVAPDLELYETIMQLANKQLTREELAKWLQQNSVKKKRHR